MLPSEVVDQIADVMVGSSDLGKAIYAVEYEDDVVGATVTVMVEPSHVEEARERFLAEFGKSVQVIEHRPTDD